MRLVFNMHDSRSLDSGRPTERFRSGGSILASSTSNSDSYFSVLGIGLMLAL
ncbi:hypothetical protein ACS0TY_014926 [Phlomoides rotata]